MAGLNYKVDLDDVRFVLFEQLKVHEELATIEAYEDFDQDMYDATIEEAARVASEVLAPLNGPGDREGCKLDADGNVTTPKGFLDAWSTIAEGGWISVAAPVDAGGVGMPAVMEMAALEMMVGANMSYMMYPGLTAAAARVIYEFGPEGMRETYAEKMFTGEWGGTMHLTEPGAGSDVGSNRTKATPIDGEPGTYALEGEKIFITGADNDLVSNIMHLVLARTPDSPPGTKGLSLFLVPKFLVKDDMSAGERNGVYVVGIEEKMGLHASSTCAVTFGDRGVARGWMVGKEHEGIKIMFHMMNEARIGVGLQGVGVCAASYHYSVAYAKDRLQGSSIKNFKDASAPRVPIIEHPDVRRMLMEMKVITEASRSMLYRLGHRHDVAHHDKEKHDKYMNRVDLLVPVLKSYLSDKGFDTAVTGVQVFGGYGYTGEYPVEQLVRDAKICSIYEGTNGIQALDFLGRKMRQKGGALFMEWMQDSLAMCEEGKALGLETEAGLLEKAINHAGATAMFLGKQGMEGNLDGSLAQAYPFLNMFGCIHLGLECMHQAIVAKKALDAGTGGKLHRGKLLNLTFYVHNMLPSAISLAKRVQSGDESCLNEEVFA